jgi:RecQ family ATP-dependent DNA helicase
MNYYILKMTDKRLESYNSILNKYWNYPSLKPEQYTIISNVLDGRDVCAVLATGFGKSICYQLPTMIAKKCVIVISPLIALMHEQSEEMKNKNIPVCVFNSTTNQKEKDQIKYNILKGEYMLIYMTPEYLLKSEHFLQKLVENDNLAMVCIDEAHAVSTWGLDFRPSYTKLNVIRDWIPEIPIVTLTATASTKVKEDITKILGLSNPYEVVGNFDRPNLTIRVYPRSDDIMVNIGTLLQTYKNEYIIIYCKTRDETDKLAESINKYGVRCQSYHAGIVDKKRNEIQQDFIDGKYKCMIATIAFGMGINIPTVRLVIHYNCPKNIESYYQEIGRAGRDGKPSECYLFYSKKDFYLNRIFLKTIIDDVHRAYQESQIRLIEKYVYSFECRRKLLLVNFGQKIESCLNCDNCLKKINYNQTDEADIDMEDYTKQVYLLLNLMLRINDKFGTGMIVNILLGKNSKVKEYMCNFEEYGTGISFGDELWWKDFVRILINNDYLIETQVKGSFGTTLSLTNKGRTIRKQLIGRFPQYINLLQTIEDYNEESDNETSSVDSNHYSNFKIMFEPIKIEPKKKTTRTSKTPTSKTPASKTIKATTIKATTKATTITKVTPVSKNIEKGDNNKTIFANNINDMPNTFLKYNFDDSDSLNDDLETELEKELSEKFEIDNNIKESKFGKFGRKKNIIVTK